MNERMELERRAREAWATAYATGRRWTFWMTLTWDSSVCESTASGHVEEWASRLQRRINGAAVFVGIHSDTRRRHAHVLVFIPRRGAPPNPPPCRWLPGITLAWYQEMWPHGRIVWLDRYSKARSTRPDGRHGAALYAARDVGSVMRLGNAPRVREG